MVARRQGQLAAIAAAIALGVLLGYGTGVEAQQALRGNQQQPHQDDGYGAIDLEGTGDEEEAAAVAAAFGAEMALRLFDDDEADAAGAGAGAGAGYDKQQQEEVGVENDGGLLSDAAAGVADWMTEASSWPFCAWDATTDRSVYTPLLLDPNAVYQPQLLTFAGHPHRVYRFKARYPKGIYFSYQSYTFQGQPLTSITDLRIKPAWGLNPYRDGNATCDTAGGYELYVTQDGSRGWPNELKGITTTPARSVGLFGDPRPQRPRGGVLSEMAVVMLRFYNVRPPQLIWGGVEPPELAYSDDDGKSWRVVAACQDGERQRFNNLMAGTGRAFFGLQDAVRYNDGARWDMCSLMARPEADVPDFFPSSGTKIATSANYVPFANYDSEYMFWCTDGQQLGPDFVMVVTGTAPIVSSGLYDPPHRAADTMGTDVRYWGLQSSELNFPRPTYASISAVMMEDYYGPKWDRRYKVVAARDRGIARACGLDDPGAMFLPFSNPASNVSEPPAFPVVVMREQLARATALGLPCGERGSIRGVIEECTAERRCFDKAFLREQMGEKLPRLQVFKCDVATGRATPFVYQPIDVDRVPSRPEARGRQYGGPGDTKRGR